MYVMMCSDSVFMVRISHTTCRVWCWEIEWMSEVVLEIHVSQCVSVRQRSSRSCCSADLSCTERSWQAFRLLCVIAKVPHHCSQREFFQRAPLYFHTGVLIKSLFLHVAVTEWGVQPLCSNGSKAASMAHKCFHDSWSGHVAFLKVMITGSHTSREHLEVLLFDALFLRHPDLLVSIFRLFIYYRRSRTTLCAHCLVPCSNNNRNASRGAKNAPGDMKLISRRKDV